MGLQEKIISVNIEDEMMKSYISYAVYVLTHRAIPNVYDGLKPVQRRILVALHEMHLTHNKPYKKTVRTIGDVMGKFHPHGNEPIYQALVRLVRPWVMRYPLVDGQGNYGSMDGDGAAHMRYTESRLKRFAEEGVLADLSKDVVPFQPNFDSSLEEPTVLPSPAPNLLLNGSTGIAVGMATNMPPHNMGEVIDAVQAYIDDNDITIEGLMQYIKAPDFPTGGIIYGYQGVKQAFETGRGQVVMRGKVAIETHPNHKRQIIVRELPYMVNKAHMIAKTAALIESKVLQGIADLRDESDREGIRVVYDLKRDAIPNVVLNNLYKYTELQSSFSVNNVALVDGTPKLVNLKDLIHHYLHHRHNVVTRRIEAALKQAQQQQHLLEGYLLVLDHLNAVIELIKEAKDPQEAKHQLITVYGLSEMQSKAVLDMRLQRLTGLERQKTVRQHQEISVRIETFQDILSDKDKRMQIIKDELHALRERYADERRTVITYDAKDFSIEDTIPNERMVITLSEQGYIKATPLHTYKLQQRGGVGSKGVATKKEDFLNQLFVASAHDYLLIFTTYGKVYWKRVYELPQGGKNTQGRAIQNLLDIAPQDTVRSILKVTSLNDPDYVKGCYVTLCTAKGIVKKMSLERFTRPLKRGIRAIRFKENDRLIGACLTEQGHYVILALRSGKAIRFAHEEVRSMGRNAAGVKGITLADADDCVIGMISTPENTQTSLLVVSEKGYGKRSAIQDYRCTRRGGKGIKTLQVTTKTGYLMAIKPVEDGDELMVMNASGIALRTKVASLRTMQRATQGVRVVRLQKKDAIASVAIVKNIHADSTES